MVKPAFLPGTWACVLCAGRSARTAPAHKLLAPDATGQPMLVQTLKNILNSKAETILALLPPDQPELETIVQAHFSHSLKADRLQLQTVLNARLGLSASLHAGVQAAQAGNAQSLLICLGDMPLVSTTLLNTLLENQNQYAPAATAPLRDGKAGNPVVWNPSQFSKLLQVTGDQGGRAVLRSLGADIRLIPANSTELVDFDTPERLKIYQQMAFPSS
ncbi:MULTISPECIES: NTP transferase domain-containing protein [Acetobacter]|uniref:Nucleotidyltransferase family protein n=2 Tax=Acetobacter TaxID=434 RepID=A0AAN1PFV6_9PROT|nr:nucleotidyltransferase family protein [Acetobacter sp. DmW_125130]ASL41234.1 molybdopterin biosynthesis protein [Acetobacter oryzifermentans]AXM99444.1 nucleotidyltransferase family protein [Acetobacter pomorum]KAA8393095.1 nucleotidyltransferase family protein [Acetobacter sp. DmW_125128]KAA8393583.1 nucleotidyltransferase family protein [Acetobacter sp. DmW_125124]KAA8396786.1 nucleotidyltransferase family protein [Acetobacter sp. DmW_125127]KAA8403615.1 nucleotidyltransferase family pro